MGDFLSLSSPLSPLSLSLLSLLSHFSLFSLFARASARARSLSPSRARSVPSPLSRLLVYSYTHRDHRERVLFIGSQFSNLYTTDIDEFEQLLMMCLCMCVCVCVCVCVRTQGP
jgi:hypothetical protein